MEKCGDENSKVHRDDAQVWSKEHFGYVGFLVPLLNFVLHKSYDLPGKERKEKVFEKIYPERSRFYSCNKENINKMKEPIMNEEEKCTAEFHPGIHCFL